MSRTALATATGLSPASLTAIAADMISQGLLVDSPDQSGESKSRGRPATRLSFNRAAAHAVIVEVDVNRTRLSLVDFGGTLVDRTESRNTPDIFERNDPAGYLQERIEQIRTRNPETVSTIRRIAISVQGIMDRDGQSLKWSPISNFAGTNLAEPLMRRFAIPVRVIKRGRLLAEGTRLLYPELRDRSVATVFVGSTVAMGIAAHGHPTGRGDDGATEFGHMNHVPDGALCRCGMRGCLEAYAADYGVLRSAYSVPERTPPAANVPEAEYAALISRARRGERNALRAFQSAGSAIGYGLSRLMTVFDPEHIIIVGPGASAFDLMKPNIESAMSASLVCSVNGLPHIAIHHDESEPIFQGLLITTLNDLDQNDAAALAASEAAL